MLLKGTTLTNFPRCFLEGNTVLLKGTMLTNFPHCFLEGNTVFLKGYKNAQMCLQ